LARNIDAPDRRPESPSGREDELASGTARHERCVALAKREAAIVLGDSVVMLDECAGEIELVGQI
jgi:hypothetical protein